MKFCCYPQIFVTRVLTSTRAMSQTPRTPHARDNASLGPSQDADDADGENDDLYGDENVDTAREQEAPPTGKKGRSANWLPCELVCALLCRQHAVREKGCQSKLAERQNAAARVYSSIIHTLDDLGLCSWSDGGDGRKLPGNARESVTQRTAPHVESKIYAKGNGVKASLKLYAQSFSRLYVVNSKNGYSPSTGDNDGKITWGATEQACVGELSVPVGFDALRLAYRIVCASSPHLTTDKSLLTYVDAAFALDPAQRLDQEDVPTEKDLKAHQKRRMKEAGNDMAFGQVQNSAAIERHDKMEEELFGFLRKCEGALTKLQDDDSGYDVQHVAQKLEELDEREQRLQNYEEEMNARMRQFDAMQQQLNAMFNAAKAHETVETPEEEVAPSSPVGTTRNVPVEVPAIPEEDGTRRSSRPRKRKTIQD
jgi:chaperonin cofactor prefoldin